MPSSLIQPPNNVSFPSRYGYVSEGLVDIRWTRARDEVSKSCSHKAGFNRDNSNMEQGQNSWETLVNMGLKVAGQK